MLCSDEMVRQHTEKLATHEARIKDFARSIARVEREVSEVRSLAQELAGNGRTGAIDRLRETVLVLSQTMAGETATIDGRARSAHHRLDEVRDELHSGRREIDNEFRELRRFRRTLAVGVVVALLGSFLQFLIMR